MAESSTELFLGRQPILDKRENLVAFELLFRSNQSDDAQIHDDLLATATVINHAFSELGVEAVLGHYTGFINLSAGLLLSDVIELLPRDRVVLELLETVEINETLITRLRELRALGFRLALDDYTGDEAKYARVLEYVDVVKVDVRELSAEQLPQVTERLRRWPVRLLAEKVDTKEQVERCIQLGYELFQGYYFARPSVLTGRRLSHAESSIMRLMGLVLSDADTQEIEQALKYNPDLSINLLRLVNSVTTGTGRRITSLREAITLLGRSQLQRWLQLLMFAVASNPDAKFPSPLLVLAATRGKLMELLSEAVSDHRGSEAGDNAFLTGIMSLMSALLGIPMTEIVRSLPIPDDVGQALVSRTGRLGSLLRLTELLEQTDIPAIEAHLQHLPGLEPSKINEAYVGAMEWANGIGEASS
ncbi:MAG: EAL domain-containing protein [Betaproteobacteria bacterium]|nr:EAL domain-containing protein [Betaproteobacteria bacterium]